jgi:hypothetical protein
MAIHGQQAQPHGKTFQENPSETAHINDGDDGQRQRIDG